jgi:adenine-specific DNA-methyltransferase
LALIEDLVNRIEDPALREALGREINALKKRLSWGLVFERHIPETTRLLRAPLKPGAVVWERRSASPTRYRVRRVDGERLVVVAEPAGTTAPRDQATITVMRDDVLVEKPFEEAVFPALTSLGSIRRGPSVRPSHAVVEGENFHALEALVPVLTGKVDVLYLDPPYNTGDKDWSYNNDYVDANDQFRPSKWLAFMERRLRLGRRLLKPDGVMVVTIDEHEVHHLGMLLEQMFPDARRSMASIVINAIGQDRDGGLARVDEQAFFIFFGSAPAPIGFGDDLLNDRPNTKRARGVRWEWLIRGGPISKRSDRAKLFYPVLIDQDKRVAVKAGAPLIDGDPDLEAKIDGYAAAWPIRTDGSHGYWRIGPAKLQRLIDKGYVRLGGFDPGRKTWTILYVADTTSRLIDEGKIEIVSRDDNGVVSLEYSERRGFSVKTIWNRQWHNAGAYGSSLLTAFLGERSAFTFPKSLYAVTDTLEILTHNRPDALVLDFFAGSGTTLHATMLLNAQDGGTRRCLLVTNNEVKAETSRRLMAAGQFRGDPEFEAAGVFEAACRPRVTAAITGKRPDGSPVEGAYLDGREYSEGFEENVEFFRLDYLDSVAVELGLCLRELHPLLWVAAGGIGERQDIDPWLTFAIPPESPYGVLLNPAGMPGLLERLAARPDVTHVFVIADSDASFADLASALPATVEKVHLYRAYLEALRGAVS